MPGLAVAGDSAYGNGSSPDATGETGSELFDLINYNIGIYNQNLELAPGFLKSLVGNEQILFVIALENGKDMYAWGSTEDAEFVEFEQLEALSDEEPSLTVRSDESTVRSIIESASPIQEFNEALKSGKVTVEDAGLLQKLMLWAMKIGLADLFM
ncbi:hypothetical protein ACSAZL_04875 [Methanosarcina sp. T3]|uniref:hypothetical protein n=1 Tax=Methanosarcina sp. T3 TaxID=3439062 RepID=UPI003F855ACD